MAKRKLENFPEKPYIWFITPLVSGAAAWILSGQVGIGIIILAATGVCNWITFPHLKEC